MSVTILDRYEEPRKPRAATGQAADDALAVSRAGLAGAAASADAPKPSQPQPEPDDDDDLPLYEKRRKIYPSDVFGFFRKTKWALLALTLGIYYALPFVRWDRGPNLPDQAVLIDLVEKRFYFFFIRLWPHEVYFFTGLLVMAALVLFLMNAVAGRIWCGYLCPQTVWTDLFMTVERFFQGDRRERIKLDKAPWGAEKIYKKTATHLSWLMIAWWTGGAWVLYFADAPTLVMELISFQAPMAAYAWIGILTFTTYFLAGHMREQVCTYMCPWPRIQAALTDDDALNVTYRLDRGEPRMSLKAAAKATALGVRAGDCVDCMACVYVCPTGIDIRDGAQLACIQCGLCIDACDATMVKIGRPTGLIGYDTMKAVDARCASKPAPPVRIIRARTMLYAAVISVVGGLMLYQLATRGDMTFAVLHERVPLFVTLKDGSIRNAYTLNIGNKESTAQTYRIETGELPGARVVIGEEAGTAVTVGPDTTERVRLFVEAAASPTGVASRPVVLILVNDRTGERFERREHFFGP